MEVQRAAAPLPLWRMRGRASGLKPRPPILTMEAGTRYSLSQWSHSRTAGKGPLQARLQSRDLVFEKDRSSTADGQLHQTTYIVNRGDLANQVAALIQLTHAK